MIRRVKLIPGVPDLVRADTGRVALRDGEIVIWSGDCATFGEAIVAAARTPRGQESAELQRMAALASELAPRFAS